MPRYQGPADNFQLEEGGKVYQPGDNVPISAALARHMGRVANGGHRFEGVQAEERPARSAAEATEAKG